MTKGISTKVYEALNAAERFRATNAAMARGDEREVERLIATCPRKSYIATDDEFSSKCLFARDLGLRVSRELQSGIAALHATDWAIETKQRHADMTAAKASKAFLDGWIAGHAQAGGTVDLDDLPDGVSDDIKVTADAIRLDSRIIESAFQERRQKLATEVSSLIQAIEKACGEMGIGAEDLLLAVAFGSGDLLSEARALVKSADPDPELTQIYVERMRVPVMH